MNVLLCEYNIEPLKTRRKRNILNLMFDQSKDDVNVRVNRSNIKLRSANKKILTSQFTRLTKVQKSPFYRGLDLWNKLPENLQNEPSKLKFKNDIKKYTFNH